MTKPASPEVIRSRGGPGARTFREVRWWAGEERGANVETLETADFVHHTGLADFVLREISLQLISRVSTVPGS